MPGNQNKMAKDWDKVKNSLKNILKVRICQEKVNNSTIKDQVKYGANLGTGITNNPLSFLIISNLVKPLAFLIIRLTGPNVNDQF